MPYVVKCWGKIQKNPRLNFKNLTFFAFVQSPPPPDKSVFPTSISLMNMTGYWLAGIEEKRVRRQGEHVDKTILDIHKLCEGASKKLIFLAEMFAKTHSPLGRTNVMYVIIDIYIKVIETKKV